MNNIGLDRVRSEKAYNFKNNLNNNAFEDEESSSIYNDTGHTCEYFEIEEFIEQTRSADKQISFFSQNVRSLPGKWFDFANQMQSLNTESFKCTVISVTELWNVPPDVVYQLPGYSPFHFTIRDNSGLNMNSGGGVGLWVDSNYSFEPIEKISIFEGNIFESQFIKLKTSKNKFSIIGNIYRPNTAPKANINRFIEILDQIMKTINSDPDFKKCESVELLGDMNIDLLKYSIHNDTARYLDTILNYNLLPLITLPTRVIHNSATLIDHILTNDKTDKFDAGIIISAISDHLPVFYLKHCEPYIPPTQPKQSRKINDKTIPIFQSLLTSTSWNDIIQENRPKQAYDIFFKTMESHIDKAFPLCQEIIKYKSKPINPWFTQGLSISCKTKYKLASKKIRCPLPENINKYKQFNYLYNKILRRAKQNYFKSKFLEYSHNLRKKWETVREALGRQKRNVSIPDFFRHDGQHITGSTEIAESFNNFFSSIGPELARTSPQLQTNFQIILARKLKITLYFVE